jgi:hypothetical protein
MEWPRFLEGAVVFAKTRIAVEGHFSTASFEFQGAQARCANPVLSFRVLDLSVDQAVDGKSWFDIV